MEFNGSFHCLHSLAVSTGLFGKSVAKLFLGWSFLYISAFCLYVLLLSARGSPEFRDAFFPLRVIIGVQTGTLLSLSRRRRAASECLTSWPRGAFVSRAAVTRGWEPPLKACRSCSRCIHVRGRNRTPDDTIC